MNRRAAMPVADQILGMQENGDRLYRMRHSAAHMMAKAVLDMFPDAKIAIGPPVENGFYYDFELPRSLTPEDLEAIEQNMREQMARDFHFVPHQISKEQAREVFHDQ